MIALVPLILFVSFLCGLAFFVGKDIGYAAGQIKGNAEATQSSLAAIDEFFDKMERSRSHLIESSHSTEGT